ncbi:MAG: trypsin-like peptidase domain-containing protein [Actinobacteria bacterium]|nr:trypsin-like peptidase domain-containing protein [Actinomycetota bacterium]MBV9253197.1 trypsin-like peptidase domain-containing protein [Actinomycetota bacterium]
MSRGLDVEAFRARAERTLRDSDIADAHDRFRNLVGPLPEEMTDLARQAFDDLRDGQTPSPDALHALELAIRMHRPALLVRDTDIDALPTEAAPAFPEWKGFTTAVRNHMGAVGCVQRVHGSAAELVGTGFAISPTAVVTNRHVVAALTGGNGTLKAGEARLCFADGGTAAAHTAPVVEVQATHPTLDVAVLRIDPDGDAPRPFAMSPAVPDVGQAVAAIGYPDDDPRSAGFDKLLFADGLGVKRVAPGEITGVHDDAFFHDCSTLGGSSGSPVVSLRDASLVGVHADGWFLARNEGVVACSAHEFLLSFAAPG